MDVRQATPGDGEEIREVARQSMYASYSMSPDTIDAAVAEWYDDGAVEDAVDDADRQFLVADRDGTVVGFADADVVGEGETGELLWLHVHPDYRGEGVARRLLNETRDALADRDVDALRGLVLRDNSEGNSFYRHHGFEAVDERELEIGGRRYVENVYRDRGRGAAMLATASGEPELEGVSEATTPEGATVYVDRSDAERGSAGSMYAAYTDADLEARWGYFCGNCESLATAMDSMGRVECSDCGNARKPSRWDASYM